MELGCGDIINIPNCSVDLFKHNLYKFLRKIYPRWRQFTLFSTYWWVLSYFCLSNWSFHCQAYGGNLVLLSQHVPRRWTNQWPYICYQRIIWDLSKTSSLLLKVKTKHEEIFLMLLGRQLNNLDDLSLKLLKQRPIFIQPLQT